VDGDGVLRARLPRLNEITPKYLDPIHPGEILMEEFLNPLGISLNALAHDIKRRVA